MKRLLKKDESLVGRTIEGELMPDNYGEKLILSFTDGTYVLFRSASGYDGDSSLERVEEDGVSPSDFYPDPGGIGHGRGAFVKAGVGTEEELSSLFREHEEAREREFKASREKQERAQYEALKKKFEGT